MHTTPWYNDHIKSAKQRRRIAERKWRKSHSDADCLAYRNSCNYVNTALKEAKTSYYHHKLPEITIQMYINRIGTTLLFGKAETKLSTHDSVQQLTGQFADYFPDRIKSVRGQFCSSILNTYSNDQDISPCSILSSFRPDIEKEITLLLEKSTSKSCGLVPLTFTFGCSKTVSINCYL